MEGKEQLQDSINKSVKKIEAKKKNEPGKDKKEPPCARCHKPKPTRKHHWPLGSKRLVPLCNHCYDVVKKQRNRSRGRFGAF